MECGLSKVGNVLDLLLGKRARSDHEVRRFAGVSCSYRFSGSEDGSRGGLEYKFHLAIAFAGGGAALGETLGGERRGASVDIEGRCVFEAIELDRVIIVAVRNSQSKKQPQRRDRACSESAGSREHSLIISLWGYRRRRRRWERRSW